jgi:hypothetical protein
MARYCPIHKSIRKYTVLTYNTQQSTSLATTKQFLCATSAPKPGQQSANSAAAKTASTREQPVHQVSTPPSQTDGLTPAQQKLLDPHDRDNWHVDGDFFHHFLDSKEQALLPIVLFKDINIGGGGTMICPDAIPTMASHLAAHPEGVMPDMTEIENRNAPYKDFDHAFFDKAVKEVEKEKFKTAVGKAGDIYLLHPLMVHSAAPNYLRGMFDRSFLLPFLLSAIFFPPRLLINRRTTIHHQPPGSTQTTLQLRQKRR